MAKKLENLIEVIRSLVRERFTGTLEINFTEGGIGKVMVHRKVMI